MSNLDLRASRPLHEFLRRHAQLTPDKVAIVWYGRNITFGELDRWSDACATVLARNGVKKGDPVALYMQNCPQYVIAHLGIQRLGAIVSPCSPLFKSHELTYQLADLGARIVIAAADLYPIVQEARAATQVNTVMLVNYDDMLPDEPTYAVPRELRDAHRELDGAFDLLAAIQQERHETPRPDLSMDDVALLVYTSGTTGRPKGAMLTFGNCLFKTSGLAEVSGMRPDDVHLAVPPLYHISGMLYGINVPLYTGATVVLHYRFDPLATLESIERHRVTYWKGIAPMLVAVMEAPDADSYDLSSLRVTCASSFGIRMTQSLSERWARFTGGCIATEPGYGLSESHTGDVITLPHEVRWGTNGKLLPGVSCRIVDPQSGEDVPPGEQGEILLKSPGNFVGYWKQPEKTAETLKNGWLHTGDIGTLDKDGYLTLVGRIKEMIKVSGYSVFPEDVEAILLKHPNVRQAAAVGVPHPSKGEVVKAFIVPRSDAPGELTEEALIAWCRENMSAYKVPRYVEFRSEFPTTVSGKVLRRLLVPNVEAPGQSRSPGNR